MSRVRKGRNSLMDTGNLGFSITNIDASADPKQDFYRFAAGGWLDQAVIPETESQVNGYTQLTRRVNEQIMTLLQNASEASADAPRGSVEQQVGDFYAAAMDTERLEALGMTPLQPELERIDAVAVPADLAATLAHLVAVTGTPMLVVPIVFTDKRQSDVNVLQIHPGALTLGNRDIYLSDAFAPLRAAFVEARVANAAARRHPGRSRLGTGSHDP